MKENSKKFLKRVRRFMIRSSRIFELNDFFKILSVILIIDIILLIIDKLIVQTDYIMYIMLFLTIIISDFSIATLILKEKSIKYIKNNKIGNILLSRFCYVWFSLEFFFLIPVLEVATKKGIVFTLLSSIIFTIFCLAISLFVSKHFKTKLLNTK